MVDPYLKFANSALGKKIAKQFGLPQPVILDRYIEGQSCFEGKSVMVGGAAQSVWLPFACDLVKRESGRLIEPTTWTPDQQLKAILYDASGIADSEQTNQLHSFFSPLLRSLESCARIVVVARIPERCPPSQQVAQRSLLGFVKSLAKEMRFGATVNLVWGHPDCEHELEAPLAFFSSDRSAYVSGQSLTVFPARGQELDFKCPLAGRNVVVTGAARGIGRAIAKLIRCRGASVTCLDVPQVLDDLQAVADEVGGDCLAMDITSQDAAHMIESHFSTKPLHGIVHNAGITRDKKLVNMTFPMWDSVVQTNLICQERINHHLVTNGVLGEGSRIVLVSSISGIGGNAGQTNYATSKAGVIGMVAAFARSYRERGIAINAVAPGFIETKMVETIPMAYREFGRRLNSMGQGGLPVDVAEAVSLFLQSDTNGLYGNVLRVCGQAILGA